MYRRTLIGASIAAPFIIPSARAAELTLKLASFATDQSSWGRAQTIFKNEIEKRTDKRIEVAIFNNNTLGSNREALELARRGSVDLVLTGVSHATRNVSQLNALIFPYLFKDRDTMFSLLDGSIGAKLDKMMLAQNLSAVGWWDNGFRHVSNSKRPIISASDIQGLKLRTLPTPVHVDFFKKIGAIPTAMDFSELLSALRQGVIDGQENPPAVMGSFRIYEVQKYYSLTGHANEPMVMVASDQTLKKIPSALMPAFKAAMAEATSYQRSINAQEETQNMETLRKSMQVNTISAGALTAFRSAAQLVYGPAILTLGTGGEELVADIVKANT
jgi:tripartite ATP-independent transporter DctP family solute receptor